MFPTHICYVCDSKLAKLDCIKMHFKNKHSEVPLDLNRVMLTRVCCYVCGVRKKEYAILVRHFQVEHKDQEIDPFRIGMDEPTPFNLTPEAESGLSKLPIPDPVRHELHQKRKMNSNWVPKEEPSPAVMDENTLDSLGDDYMASNHIKAETEDDHLSPPAKKKAPRRLHRAFKNNKCTVCSKAFSRVTTAKKHFLDQHPHEPFDRSKIEVTQLPCYLCETMISDSRQAVRHFETAHPGHEYDARQVQVCGVEITNGAGDEEDLDESLEDADQQVPTMDLKPPPTMDLKPPPARKNGFRCFLCNFWCSTIDDFQAHFAPDNKAHDNVSEVTIICPLCDMKCQTTDEMFVHVTKEHKSAVKLTTRAKLTTIMKIVALVVEKPRQ